LQYLTTDFENKEALWENESIRAALIEATQGPREGKVRVYGLGSLWNLSSCSQNQEKMWLDENFRSVVMDVAREGSTPEDGELQERAMAVFWNLSAAEKNKAPMWQDEAGVRAALFGVLGSDSASLGRQSKQYALGALRNLAEDSQNRGPMWQDAGGARKHLLDAAIDGDNTDQVSSKRAFKTLCTLAYEPTNVASMWEDVDGLRAQIICNAQVPETGHNDVHLSALRALQALSVEASNKKGMWVDEGVRSALVESAKLSKPEESKTQVCALSTLKNLTTEPATMEGMWSDSGVRSVLVKAAAAPAEGSTEPPAASRARAVAMGALRNIASTTPNKEPMWADADGARAAILAAAGVAAENLGTDARESRMHAIAALRYFASITDGVTDPLWQNCKEAQVALVAAAKLKSKDHSDNKAREYAVAALRHSS